MIYLGIAAISFVVLVPLTAARILMRRFLRRYDMDKYSFSLRVEDMQGKYAPRIVHFKSGGNTLCGYIFGEDAKKGLIIFCHGLFGGAAEYFAFARHFVDEGYAVFMFDNTGCNESGGRSIIGSLQGLRDLRRAMRYLKENECELFSRKKALIGHSWGGFTAAAYRNTDELSCVISLAGFDRPVPAMYDFLIGYYGRAMKLLFPYVYLFTLLQYGSAFRTSSVAQINKTDLPYLIIQGTNDKIIHVDGSSIYNQRSRIKNPNVRFVLRSDPLHNKHNTIYRDADATRYMEERYRAMRKASAIINPHEREAARKKVFLETDRFRINKLDSEFAGLVDDMLDKFIG